MKIVGVSMVFANMNTRVEKAGKQLGPGAVDMTLEGTYGEATLPMFFRNQEDFDGFKAFCWSRDGLLARQVGPIPYNHGIMGGSLEVASEIGDIKIKFDKADLDTLTLMPADNFICHVRLRAKIHPEDDDVSRLFAGQKRELLITAAPPQMDLPLSDKPDDKPGAGPDTLELQQDTGPVPAKEEKQAKSHLPVGGKPAQKPRASRSLA